jgi:hypothetical protein
MEWVHSTLEHGEPVNVNNIPKGADKFGVLNSWTGQPPSILPKIFLAWCPNWTLKLKAIKDDNYDLICFDIRHVSSLYK